MTISRSLMMSCIAVWALAVIVVPNASAVGYIGLGQKIHVDDGTCPSGQIKEIFGAKLTPQGVQHTIKCVPRK